MKIWFTSDHHFGHANVIKYCRRPFESLHHMHRVLIDKWNAVVADGDVVYHLGDFAMGDPALWFQYCQALHGTKILIRGNHDRGVGRMRAVGFAEVYNNVVIEVAGIRVWMNHYPLDTQGHRPAAPSAFDIALCGHVHQRWLVHGGCVNVGVDVWNFTPTGILELMRVRQEAMTSVSESESTPT